jgi:plasmid stabilization system protein ParE
MRLILHRKVHDDIGEIMGYYEREDTPDLADEFYAELRHFMEEAAKRPESFSIRERDLRRVNLRRFLIIFYFASWAIWFEYLLCAITAGIPL